jgi:zinc resistance-associated protein
MKRWIIGTVVGCTLIGSAAVAQQGHWMRGEAMDRGGRGMMDGFSPEDREAFTDARIASLRAGLKLTPDQEKLWPAVEDALRGLDTQQREQMGTRRDVRRQLRDDFPAAIRSMAERRAAHAEALRRIADATAPLYATLDEGQKRRAGLLMRSLRSHESARAERKRPRGSDRQGRDND